MAALLLALSLIALDELWNTPTPSAVPRKPKLGCSAHPPYRKFFTARSENRFLSQINAHGGSGGASLRPVDRRANLLFKLDYSKIAEDTGARYRPALWEKRDHAPVKLFVYL